VVGAVGSAYSAYQGVKEIYNAVHDALNQAEDNLDMDLPTDEELAQLQEDVAQLPTAEEEAAAFEDLTTTLDEVEAIEPSLEEIRENIFQRFTNYFPEYAGQVPFNDQTPNETNPLQGEDLEAAEEAAAEEAAADYEGVEGVGALTEGLAETVAEESAYDTIVDVAGGIGEVLLDLVPFGI
jgi:hypothetical protein